jgi:hypothetical protein
MRQHPARATMYAQIEQTLTSITLPLRAAIRAAADVAARASERTGAAVVRCQPAVRGIAMTTCAERLSLLTRCRDASTLKSALQELCTEFGKVTHIDVLTMAEAERRRALCFLRLESPAQEQALMRSFGAPRFGDDVLIVIDLPRNLHRSAG